MKVVVGLCAVLPFTGWPLLTGPWSVLNSITLTAFTAGDQTKMDRSFPSCTTEHVHQQRQNVSFRDGLQCSNRVWICCCSLMKSWLIMFFLHKFALVRSDDWWVSFTRPWAVFTRLGRPDEWLVRTLNAGWPDSLTHLCGTRGRWVNDAVYKLRLKVFRKSLNDHELRLRVADCVYAHALIIHANITFTHAYRKFGYRISENQLIHWYGKIKMISWYL